MSLVAGVDCSTQSTKVLVVDDAGQVVAQGSAPHTVTGTGGARETDPAVWEEALGVALAQTGHSADIDAISIGGQQHGLVIVDAAGVPLRPAVLWNDTRSAEDATRIVAELGGAEATARRVGSVPTAAFTVTSWAWLRRTEPETASKVRGVRLPHDHLNATLTGQASTDRSDVSGTGWWSPPLESYATDVLERVDLDPSFLPKVLGAEDSAGQVTPAAAARFGLRAGIPVGCGAGDNAAGALALALTPGDVAVSLGTSGTVFASAAHPSADPSGVVAGFAGADGRYLPLACTLNATTAVDRIATWLGLARDRVEPSAGVVCLPWFDGERTPNLPTATGSLWGLRHSTPPGAILQAAYEGVVATLLDAAAIVGQWSDVDPGGPLLLIGGGARGDIWRRTVLRLSGRAVVVPDHQELVAYGAAIQAATILSGAPLTEVATAWEGRRGTVIEPVARDEETLARIAAWTAAATAYAQG